MGNISLYETRTLADIINQAMPVRTFFKDTFFNKGPKTHVTQSIDIEFKRGKRQMAPFVSPIIGGKPVKRYGHSTKSIKAPHVGPQKVLTAADLEKRQMGENIYSTKTPAERAASYIAEDLIELDDFITRREEWLCRQVLLEGRIEATVEDGENVEIDFGFQNKETLQDEALWTHANSDPLADLERYRLAVVKESGVAPTTVIMASDVANTFINHPKIKSLLDIRNLNIASFTPSIKDDAIRYYGTITSLGLEIYSYDEWFMDDSGVEQAMIPSGHLIMAKPGQNTMHYGAVTIANQNKGFETHESTRVPYQLIKENSIVTGITSRPVPVPSDVASWYVAEVL